MDTFERQNFQSPSFLPAFLPGETLYSLCARYHYSSGNRLAAKTSGQLFGVATAAMLHDFPAHLAAFETQTAGRLGDASAVALNRTLLAFYVPYQPLVRITAAIEAMKSAGIGRLKFRFGLPSSRIGGAHPLKACPKCIREELDQHGFAYWHLIQQHPAVWLCAKHGELLIQSTGKSKTQNKLQWVLPHTLGPGEWKVLPPHLGKESLLLARLNTFASGSCNKAATYFEPRSLRECYLRGAKNSGWLTRSGSVRLRAARDAFLDQAAGLIGIPEFKVIESVSRGDGGFLGKVLRNPRSHLHPTKHLLVQSLLFESWEEFCEVYREVSDLSYKRTGQHSITSQSSPKVVTLLALAALGDTSLAQIARNLEVPYDIARYWLKRAGVAYSRPKRT